MLSSSERIDSQGNQVTSTHEPNQSQVKVTPQTSLKHFHRFSASLIGYLGTVATQKRQLLQHKKHCPWIRARPTKPSKLSSNYHQVLSQRQCLSPVTLAQARSIAMPASVPMPHPGTPRSCRCDRPSSPAPISSPTPRHCQIRHSGQHHHHGHDGHAS